MTAKAEDLSPIKRIGPTPTHRVGPIASPAPVAALDQNERRVCAGIRILDYSPRQEPSVLCQ